MDPLARFPSLHREIEAKRDLGHTAVRPSLAALLSGVFLGLIFSFPLLQLDTSNGDLSAFRAFARSIPEALDTAADRGLWAGNRVLLAGIDRFETRLEEESWIVQRLLPSVQLFLTGTLGMGNQQVYLGKDGWLFYRPGVDSLTGPGFLKLEILEHRRGMGDTLNDPVEPDPRPAIRALHRDLVARGIRLLVLPAPVKGTVHPEKLTGRPANPPLRNRSFDEFIRSLEGAGIPVLDVSPLLADAAGREAQYLETDSHWTPDGMEIAALALAEWIEENVPFTGPRRSYRTEERPVQGIGDLARILELPPGQRLYGPQQITVRQVLEPDGALWTPDPSAEILILGDSFTNVFSREDLGWSTGAGLAERLSALLGRSVDRIAINAGGAHASRQALARELAAGRDRLAGKKLVVYEFAARELAVGDWRRIDLPGGAP
jgi:SGNH hydrolase-like domain, acetyltransferase AlgX